MSRSDTTPRTGRSDLRRAGYSLVEVMISIVIIGGMFVAALHTLGAAKVGQRRTTDRARGQMLAQGLMDEVLRQAYAEPSNDAVFGAEADEDLDGTRAAFDDVDDYDGWTSAPPTARDGSMLADFEDWQRSVTVDLVELTAPDSAATAETGLKRIRVVVTRGEAIVAEMVALRSRATDARRSDGAIQP